MKAFLTIFTAAKTTLSSRKMAALFIVLWAAFFAGMFAIPLASIPGNDILFQAELFRFKDYALLLLLSFFGALTLTVQTNIFVQKFGTVRQNLGSAAFSGIGLLSGISSSIFASATCGMCLTALFGFLGFGAVMTLVQYRWYIMFAAFLFLFVSLYFASRRLNEGCRACTVSSKNMAS
ncbi:MAG: hypothetical protein HYT94_01135 [Parcubacteria group bacterium]|nr:hypothetical protein [Parcubacteria group bacterium]